MQVWRPNFPVNLFYFLSRPFFPNLFYVILFFSCCQEGTGNTRFGLGAVIFLQRN